MKKRTRNVKASTIEKLDKVAPKTNIPTLITNQVPSNIPPPINNQVPSNIPPPINNQVLSNIPPPIINQVPSNIPPPIINQVPSNIPPPINNQVPSNIPPPIINQVLSNIPPPIINQVPSNIPPAIINQVPSNIPPPIINQVPSNIPSPIINQVPSNIPPPITNQVPSNIPSPITNQVPSNIPPPPPNNIPPPINNQVPSNIPPPPPNNIPPPINNQVLSNIPPPPPNNIPPPIEENTELLKPKLTLFEEMAQKKLNKGTVTNAQKPIASVPTSTQGQLIDLIKKKQKDLLNSPLIVPENIGSNAEKFDSTEGINEIKTNLNKISEFNEIDDLIITAQNFNISLGQGLYKYVSPEKVKEEEKKDLISKFDKYSSASENKIDSLLHGKSEEQQKDILYSAIFNNDKVLAKALKEHETDLPTNKLDDFDEPIMKKGLTFSVETIQDIEKNVKEAISRITESIKESVKLQDLSIEEKQANNLLNKKDKEKQLEVLQNAIVDNKLFDNNGRLLEALVKHTYYNDNEKKELPTFSPQEIDEVTIKAEIKFQKIDKKIDESLEKLKTSDNAMLDTQALVSAKSKNEQLRILEKAITQNHPKRDLIKENKEIKSSDSLTAVATFSSLEIKKAEMRMEETKIKSNSYNLQTDKGKKVMVEPHSLSPRGNNNENNEFVPPPPPIFGGDNQIIENPKPSSQPQKISFTEKLKKKSSAPIRGNFLDEIQKGKNLKSSIKAQSNNMDIDRFKYIPEIGKKLDLEDGKNFLFSAISNLRDALEDPEKEAKEIKKLMRLEKQAKPEEEQLNILYSAALNGNNKLVQNICDYGEQKIFTKENCQKIYNALQKIINLVETIKKPLVEKCIKTLVREKDLTQSKNIQIERD